MDPKYIKPLSGKVLLQKIDLAEKTSPSGLIVLPEKQDMAHHYATGQAAKVIAVNPDDKLDFKKGDTVIVGRHAGEKVRSLDENTVIVDISDIIGVVEL